MGNLKESKKYVVQQQQPEGSHHVVRHLSLTIIALLLITCKNPFSNDENEKRVPTGSVNLIDYELVYKQHVALAPGLDNPDAEYDALVYCCVVGDTVIGELPVYRYRFIKVRPDTAETTMNYMEITDSSIINHAYWGNEPFVFLKRRIGDAHTIQLEETPYATLLFPYKENACWYTRPETTGVYSTKHYTLQERITVEAGTFECAKITTKILPQFSIEDVWAEQWWNGTVLIKGFINYGQQKIFDAEGNVIGYGANASFESFELKKYRKK